MNKTSKTLLALGLGALVIVGVLATMSTLNAQQGTQCCEWFGHGWGRILVGGEYYYFFQHWHAKTIYLTSAKDTIIGCWYDQYGHGGNLYGWRQKTGNKADSAWGVIYANGTTDDYCEDSIHIITPSLSYPWAAKWMGCCKDQSPYVDGEWGDPPDAGGDLDSDSSHCIESPNYYCD